MSEPQPPMDQAEQAKVTRAVGRALLGVAPPDWTSIRAEYRSAGRHIEVDVFVAGPDQVTHPVRPPMEVVEGLGALRAGMYQPGRGTWLSAIYTLEPPSSFSVDFDPDNEPQWRRLPPPIGFQDELRFFPRTDEYIPPWFRHRAGLPPNPNQPAPPTPPTGIPAPNHPGAPPPVSGIPGPPPPPPPGGGIPAARPAFGHPPTPPGASFPGPAPTGAPEPHRPPAGSIPGAAPTFSHPPTPPAPPPGLHRPPAATPPNTPAGTAPAPHRPPAPRPPGDMPEPAPPTWTPPPPGPPPGN